MRKIIFSLGVICLLLLIGCGENNVTEEDQNAVSEEESEELVEQEKNEPEKDSDVSEEESGEENNNSPEETSTSGAEGILIKAAEAASNITGMTITGEVNSTTNMMGQVTEEYSQVNGEISMNPFVQHLTMELQSIFGGVTENTVMEMYLTPEAIYMTESELNQWMILPLNQGFGDLSSIMTDSHYSHFTKFHDAFELTENNDHYILTLTGSGDSFKEIIFGSMKDLIGEEGYQSFMSMVTDLSGTYELVFDKQNYHLVALNTDWEQTIDVGFGETHVTEQSNYQYSDFNNIEPVVVPEDVIHNAQSMFNPSSSEENE